MSDIIIYKSNGHLLGFIRNDNLYSNYGDYLGWKEGIFIWDFNGQYRGNVFQREGHNFIFKYLFDVPPIPQSSRIMDKLPPSALPNVDSFIGPITIPLGYIDGF